MSVEPKRPLREPSSTEPYPAIFEHETLARSQAPAGLTGPGTVRVTPEALVIDTQRSPQNLMSLVGLVAVFWMIVCYGFIGSWLAERGLQPGTARFLAFAIGIAPIIGAMNLVRRLVRPKPVTVTIPWKMVEKVKVDGQGRLEFFCGARPRGWVWLRVSDPSRGAELADILHQRGLPPLTERLGQLFGGK